MKILSDTLQALVETWEDPGDYPNAVAQSPLPSYNYLAGVEGELVLELTDEEVLEMEETIEAESLVFWMLEVVDHQYPDGIMSATWQIDKREGNIVTLSMTEIEADPNWRSEDK